jgi:hypothetical protein
MTLRPLSQPGIFVYRLPAKPVFQIGRNLLLLFCTPEAGLITGVISDPNGSPAELVEMLDNAFRHLLEHLGQNQFPIRAKLFGASHGGEAQLRAVLQWLEQHGLKLEAKDVGRQFPRHITVDSATARVSVSYGRAATAGDPELLSLGSARSRLTPTSNPLRVLILSSSPVERRLAQQAIEEYPEWSVEAPADPVTWLANRGPQSALPHPLVLVCAGADREIELETFFSRHKSNAFCWVGPVFPEFLKHHPGVLYLGPLDPEFLGEFKGGLAELLRSLQGTPSLRPSSKPRKSKHS